MDIYGVRVVEKVEKMVLVRAKDAAEAQYQTNEMNDDEFDSIKIIGSQSTSVMLNEGAEKDNDDDDTCDGFDDCDECPDYCEVCGSCAKEADFVSNRGKCANCEFRCSACKACTIDE